MHQLTQLADDLHRQRLTHAAEQHHPARAIGRVLRFGLRSRATWMRAAKMENVCRCHGDSQAPLPGYCRPCRVPCAASFLSSAAPADEALGNFPQGFTHLVQVSATYNLDRVLSGQVP
jgi:hypothetical protein